MLLSKAQRADALESLRLWPYEVPAGDVACGVVFLGQPLGKERPRLGKNGVYTPRATRGYEDSLRALFYEAVGFHNADAESAFGLRCRFHRSGVGRVDTDNMVKSVQDAANGVVWGDDSQVAELFAARIFLSDRPRAEVLIYRVSCQKKGG